MSLCFVVGSQRDILGRPYLRVLHSIEYLTYDLEAKCVDVWGDFIVENVSRIKVPLRGLHRGNVEFISQTQDWLRDERWTSVLFMLAAQQLGLTNEANSDAITLHEPGHPARALVLLTGGIDSWGPPRPNPKEYCFFTGWQSPLIEPGQCVLFRIAGRLEYATYHRLMPHPRSRRPISIAGGVPLLREITDDLGGADSGSLAEYTKAFREFCEEYLCTPEYYHAFFERRGDHPLETRVGSFDIIEGCVNREVDGRMINWYWSDSDFNIYAQANGPVLEIRTR